MIDNDDDEDDGWIVPDNVNRERLSQLIGSLVAPPKNRVRYDVDPRELARLEKITGGDVEKEEKASEIFAMREDRRELKRLREEKKAAKTRAGKK